MAVHVALIINNNGDNDALNNNANALGRLLGSIQPVGYIIIIIIINL
jgi:hypothetical protein